MPGIEARIQVKSRIIRYSWQVCCQGVINAGGIGIGTVQGLKTKETEYNDALGMPILHNTLLLITILSSWMHAFRTAGL